MERGGTLQLLLRGPGLSDKEFFLFSSSVRKALFGCKHEKISILEVIVLDISFRLFLF